MKHYLHSLLYCVLGGMILLSGCNKEPKADGEEVKADFTFETLELTQGSFGVKISPVAKDQTYYFGIITKADYTQFSSPEELQAADVARIKQIAEENEVDLEKFLMEALLKGDQTWTYTALAPETEYVFYAYGLSTDCQIQTVLNTYSFQTPAVAPVDIKFEITVTDLKPTSFTLNVKPSIENCAYYYDVITPDQYREYGSDLQSFVEAFLSTWKETDQYKDYSMPEFIDEVTAKGEVSDNRFTNLLPEGTYYGIAVAVANDGTCMSEVEVKQFQTTESPRNEYTVSSIQTTDVSCAAVISAKESEAFAVMMELKEYFVENGKELSDTEIVKAIYEANNKNISKYMFADAANVKFNDLIPNDNYYLLVFACNPDGTPKLDDKVNLKKVDVKTEAAKPSNAKFSLRILSSTITKNSVGVQVELDDPTSYKYETFLVNYIKDSEYQNMSDKVKGLQEHMDKYIDATLKAYNEEKGYEMTRKEFLSRNLFSDNNGATYSTITLDGMESDTKYQVYVIGLKADGTYTTAPVLAEFKTLSATQCMASLEFIVQAYGFKDKQMDKYWAWVYPHGDFKEYYVKSFIGKDDWSGKSANEVEKLLKVDENKAPAQSNHTALLDVKYGETWYLYAVIYDNSGQRSSVYRLEHTCPETGDGANDVIAVTVPVDVEELK